LGIVVAIAGGSAALAAALVKKGGAVTAVYTATATSTVSTTSNSYVDVPDMQVTVTVPSRQRALLIITFSAETFCLSNSGAQGGCFVTATVNGAGGPQPPSAIFASTTAEYESHSMQFVAGPLAAGNHIVRIRYSPNVVGGYFEIGPRTLTVLRSKVAV
jgi:hypothetical protein